MAWLRKQTRDSRFYFFTWGQPNATAIWYCWALRETGFLLRMFLLLTDLYRHSGFEGKEGNGYLSMMRKSPNNVANVERWQEAGRG